MTLFDSPTIQELREESVEVAMVYAASQSDLSMRLRDDDSDDDAERIAQTKARILRRWAEASRKLDRPARPITPIRGVA